MIPFNILTATRHGMLLANVNDAYVGRSLLVYGEFSQLEVDTLARYITPGDIVLDIGANVGALTIPLARLVGPGGCVLAFEPQRIPYQSLCANAALGSLTNVVTHQMAVGCEGDSILVPMMDPAKPGNFGALELGKADTGQSVPLIRLDALPPAKLVKVDVEGMEPDVLMGGMAYIRQHRPVLYLESDRDHRRAELGAVLAALEYDAWWDCPPLYSPTNWRGNPHNLWPGVVSVNWLCLPKGSAAPEGLEPVTLDDTGSN